MPTANTPTDLVKASPHSSDTWDGYTLEELRYRRAYVAARRELEKERLAHNLGAVRQGASGSAASIMRRAASMVPALDYGIMAFTLGSKIFRAVGKLRRRK